MTRSPTAVAIAEALDELDLYADTDEAEAARVLVRALLFYSRDPSTRSSALRSDSTG